ncbi:MAG: aspartate aminotransferase family protein [Chloroflexota bacterium]|nr:aspartate aminotransferase family protein [Chloroflexota bacterium]
MTTSAQWMELEKKYYMFVVRRQPVVLVRGKGTRVWDADGKEYLDFTAGWAVNNVGHANPVVAEAIARQAATLLQTSNQFYTIPQLQLAQILVDNSALDKVFICNSGAEANEGACKLARKYGKKSRNGAYEVITALNSFHGRTMGMIAATGQPHYQENFKPLAPGFVNVPYNDIEAIMSATNDRTAAVMLEPVQGEGGVNIPSEDYLLRVRKWCDEKGLLLMFDEVQTGLGRLGTLWGYQQFGVEPDVMTLAKGLASGVPIGAILAKESASVFVPGEHGSTFGGNPLACAAAYANVKYILDNDVAGNAMRVGQYLMEQLNGLKAKYPFIVDVRGRGLLVAVEFAGEIAARLLTACLERGLLVNKLKPNALRLMPSLIIGKAEADEAVRILDAALATVSSC